jgi:hypothetical protein
MTGADLLLLSGAKRQDPELGLVGAVSDDNLLLA